MITAILLAFLPQDLAKRTVEWPLKTGFAPLVEPAPRAGLVRWHDSLETAKAAAATSGKPVLLFQLLGRLDDEFC